MKANWLGRLGLIAGILLAAGMLAPRAARSQDTPSLPIACYECIPLFPDMLDWRCHIGMASAGHYCYEWIEDGHWHCQTWNPCAAFSEEPASELTQAVSSEVAALLFAGEAAESWSADEAKVWVSRSCGGGELAAYVQTPGDRFVPIAP